MSRTSGMFSRMTFSSVRRAAAIAGSAAFLAPLMRTVPSSGLPPRITNLSIRVVFDYALRGQLPTVPFTDSDLKGCGFQPHRPLKPDAYGTAESRPLLKEPHL